MRARSSVYIEALQYTLLIFTPSPNCSRVTSKLLTNRLHSTPCLMQKVRDCSPSKVSSRKFSLGGGSSLGSSCYVSYMWSIAFFWVVPSLACGAVTSLACYESAFAYDLILLVISLGGKLPPCPPQRNH